MTIPEILQAANPENKLQVLNSPFVYTGKTTLNLEGGEDVFWIFAEDERMLSVNPTTDEVVAFMPYEEELSVEEDAIVYRGEEYELSYEDKGSVTSSEDGADFDDDTQVSWRDYEAEDGEIIRIIQTTQHEDPISYIGQATLEDDILKA
ncbi:MAG: hypothetical protein ABIH67_00980 [Candidatus Uhrbacteria bacterium]